jgi:hypothetical protein
VDNAALSPYAERLLRLMAGPAPASDRFTGEPPDPSRLTDTELGALFGTAWRTARHPDSAGFLTALAILTAVRERSLAFSPAACRALFDDLAGAEPQTEPRETAPGIAVGALLRCTGPWPGGLAEPAAALLRATARNHAPYARLTLAKIAGAELPSTVDDGPIVTAEFAVAAGLDASDTAVLAEADGYPTGRQFGDLPDLVDRLAAIDAYAAFAREALEEADTRVTAIHSGQTPYASDKAFTPAEGAVVGRACQVALLRDEPWLGDLLGRLLPGVSVAPSPGAEPGQKPDGTSGAEAGPKARPGAKTMPSQSVCSALGRAVDAFPTPEAVAALREARKVVRHAGAAKKLDRFLRSAERGLARRPTVALRLSTKDEPTRAQLATVARALEGGYALDTTYLYEAIPAEVRRRLVWDFEVAPGEWTSALGDDEKRKGTTVRLWHPLRADEAQRAAWRDLVLAGQLRQPFRQAFRETYTTDPDQFAGYVVAVRPLLGLAIREGWRADDRAGVLRRAYGSWRVELDVHARLFPTAAGYGDTGAVRVTHPEESEPPPVLVSEAMRAVDLLVSVAAFGLDDDPELRRDERRWRMLAQLAERPLGEMARMRKAVLRRILPATVTFSARHAHVGPYAVHLATARVTRDGEPVPVDADRTTATPLPWLPYDETLLERVARTVTALLNGA